MKHQYVKIYNEHTISFLAADRKKDWSSYITKHITKRPSCSSLRQARVDLFDVREEVTFAAGGIFLFCLELVRSMCDNQRCCDSSPAVGCRELC